MLAMIGGIWVGVRWNLDLGRHRAASAAEVPLLSDPSRQPAQTTRGCDLRRSLGGPMSCDWRRDRRVPALRLVSAESNRLGFLAAGTECLHRAKSNTDSGAGRTPMHLDGFDLHANVAVASTHRDGLGGLVQSPLFDEVSLSRRT